jgi:predicted O-methyltransferase YrrM
MTDLPAYVDERLPETVQRAIANARDAGFAISSEPEAGRLLAALVAHLPHGRVGEAGTGFGVGTAWMCEALAPTAGLVTVELEASQAEGVRALLGERPNVTILSGDWRRLAEHAPFDLLFIDVRPPKWEDASDAVELLAPGGMAVLDDMTPLHLQDPEMRAQVDPVRRFWLRNPQLRSVEVQVTELMSVILAVRVD